MQKSTRDYSSEQEKYIAKRFHGKVQPNSGGTRFGGGDVHTRKMLIEAKTPMKEQSSFSIKKEWIAKVDQQAFEQRKDTWSLAFCFEPGRENYYVISEHLMKLLLEYLEGDQE